MIHLAAADGVELVFHLGRELVVDQVGQMRFEQLRDGEGRPGGHQHVAALELEHVLAGEDRVDDRGVGARPADAHFFQRPGERGFAVAIGRLRGVALRLQRRARERLAHATPPAAPPRGRPDRPRDRPSLRRTPADSRETRSSCRWPGTRAPSTSMVIVTRCPRASVIWLAIVRFQIRS